MNKALCILGAVLLLLSKRASAEEKWTVHEWGTFTSLQDEKGRAIGGINTDDEPVPAFVHRLENFNILPPGDIPQSFFKGVPTCHPDVNMRLETPVIYFYPPKSETGIRTADVHVTFHGGWLTEFYPGADADAPGLLACTNGFPRLLSSSESKLEWNDLKIGGDWPVTSTAEHVWTSPRAVQSALVQTTNGESEKFLFYRGVGHINAPLKISRDANSGELLFRSQLEELPINKPLEIRSIWLVDIKPGGKIAFRSPPPLSLEDNPNKILAHTPAVFTSGDFSAGNLEKLKMSLQAALISEGLFADEAQALLNTWELSYFKSPGRRVFFLVPREWTDFYLPLEISRPADINRVMVGRIELVTPEQRLALMKIARYPVAEIIRQAGQLGTNFISHIGTIYPEWDQVVGGKKSLSTFISIPDSYQTYLELGRFRNALILDEVKARPTQGLTNFVATYRLQAYQPVETPPRL
jgi:hypothetical protein